MMTLISVLNITSYQGLLKTALDKAERQTIQTLLRERRNLAKAAYAQRRFEAAPKRWSVQATMIATARFYF
jgi:hypothetical protein